MTGQVIGKSMTHGYAGSYSRQPDSVIDSHSLSGENSLPFGLAVVYGENGSVTPFGASDTPYTFVGIAGREVKSAVDFANQNVGEYNPGDAVAVIKRGCVNVICQYGTPALGGDVYVRTVLDQSGKPKAVIGGFEAQADAEKNVKLLNVRWNGTSDANGVAELRIETIGPARQITADQVQIPQATTVAYGTVKQAANVAQASGTVSDANFNSLLTALINAGIMAAE